MAVTIESTSNRGQLYLPDFQTQNDLGEIAYTEKMQGLFREQTVPPGAATYIHQPMTGTVPLAQIAEGSTLPAVSRLPRYRTVYTRKKYAQRIILTKEFMADMESGNEAVSAEVFDPNNSLTAARNRASTNTRANMFINGFNTAYTKYGDGKPLFSTVHPRVDGGSSWSNASSTGEALSYTAVKNAFINIENQPNDLGLPIDRPVDGDMILLLPPELADDGYRIENSELVPGTTNNDRSALRGRFRCMVVAEIGGGFGGSSTAWFLINGTKVMFYQFKFQSMELKMFDDLSNETTVISISDYWDVGWSDPRYAYGSKGDGAAYSS